MAKKIKNPDEKVNRLVRNRTIGLDKTFMYNMLMSKSHTSSENQQHVSKDDALGIHKLFDKTPLSCLLMRQ